MTLSQGLSEVEARSALAAFIDSAVGAADIGADVDLFEAGLVNSLFALELITFMEERFGIEIETGDLEPGNFRSIAAQARFVLGKLSRLDVGHED